MIKVTKEFVPGDIITPEDIGMNCTCSFEVKPAVITRVKLSEAEYENNVELVTIKLGYYKCPYKESLKKPVVECTGSYIQKKG